MKNQLLEISLIVEDELVEPVSEVLAQYTKGGIAIESTAIEPYDSFEGGKAIGPLRVLGYIPVDEKLEEIRQKLIESLWYLGRIRPLPEPQFRTVNENDWAEAWKQHYHPIPIGKKLMIVPAWLPVTEPKRVAVRIDPGLAFGTGTHPTTQLCLELVENLLTEPYPFTEPPDVIDIGTGSAILSIAALLLGARRALGVDIDADAVRAARENAILNLVSDRIELKPGSLSEIQAGKFDLKRAHIVLANILAPVCIRLLNEGLADLLHHPGRLILSGILDTQSGEVITAANNHGLQLDALCQNGEWVALKFSNNP